jgi:hypothetical protein
MDILGGIMLVVFAAVVFFTLMAKLLAPKPPQPEEEGEAPRRAEPTPTDVDRFLAEVNRRRREAERQPPQPQAQPSASPRAEPRRDQDRELQRARQRETQRRSERPAPVVRRVSEEQARRLPMVQAVEVVEAIVETAPEPARRLPTGNEGRGAGRISPVLTAALPLLRSPRALGAAIVLQEIFGPPLCRRRR